MWSWCSCCCPCDSQVESSDPDLPPPTLHPGSPQSNQQLATLVSVSADWSLTPETQHHSASSESCHCKTQPQEAAQGGPADAEFIAAGYNKNCVN